MTGRWIVQLQANADRVRIAVLDGQVRPSMAGAAFEKAGVARGRIVLIDRSHAIRERRLRQVRQQPELASRDMAAWAAYLRGRPNALGIPIVDTTDAGIEDATDALAALVIAAES
jgi:hypothetical protein